MKTRQSIHLILPLVVVLAVTLACAVPIPFLSGSTPAATTPPSDGTAAAPGAGTQDPSQVLTEAAGTLYAPLAATWTAQAAAGTVEPGAPTAAAPAAGGPTAAAPTAAAPAQTTPVVPSGAPTAAPGERPLIQPVAPGGAQPTAAAPSTAPTSAAGQPPLIQPVSPSGGQPTAQAPAQGGTSPLMPPLPTATLFWLPVIGGSGQGQAPAQPAATERPLIQPESGGGGPQTTQAPQQPAATQAPQQPAATQALSLPQTSNNYVAFPIAGFNVQPGDAFGILGVTTPVCGGIYSLNFLVTNPGSEPFESSSFQVTDLTTGKPTSEPVTSDKPFMTDDTTCTPGGTESLAPGNGLFMGGSLGAANLSGHTVRVDLKLCTANGQGGQCSTRSVDFVVP